MAVRSVCVFCAASSGLDAKVHAETKVFAKLLREKNARLVYGGGANGLMGDFANASLAAGSEVIGVITERLSREHEVAHRGLTELKIVKSLFERKRLFFELSDAFLVYPGGFGTLDELLEVLTWKGLGEMHSPLVLVNIDGFWDSLLGSFKDLEKRKVLRAGAMDLMHVVHSTAEAFDLLFA